jgi:cleavage and polyadenylation specificity factor subunit 1
LPIRTEEQYQLYVLIESRLSPVLSFERHQICTSVAFVRTLENYQIENSNFSEYLAVGTAFMCHEERQMRGTLAIYKGNLVWNEQRHENEYEFRELYKKIQQAPVTAISEVDGYIATFVGGRLQMSMFLNEEAIKEASFLNGHFYCTQMLSLKNYVFFVDAFKGFQLVRWRRYGNKMITIGCDFTTHLPLAAGLMTENGRFGGVVFDDFGNAQVFDIDEYSIPIDSFVIRSVFHIGCRVMASGHFPIKGERKDEIAGHFTWFVSDKGRFGLFSPIRDDIIRRNLCCVQTAYEKALVGLSHLEYRHSKFPMLRNQEGIIASPRLIVDIDLLKDLLDSPPELLRQCVRSLGKSPAEVLGR